MGHFDIQSPPHSIQPTRTIRCGSKQENNHQPSEWEKINMYEDVLQRGVKVLTEHQMGSFVLSMAF
jgi:hypothetical protein